MKSGCKRNFLLTFPSVYDRKTNVWCIVFFSLFDWLCSTKTIIPKQNFKEWDFFPSEIQLNKWSADLKSIVKLFNGVQKTAKVIIKDNIPLVDTIKYIPMLERLIYYWHVLNKTIDFETFFREGCLISVMKSEILALKLVWAASWIRCLVLSSKLDSETVTKFQENVFY